MVEIEIDNRSGVEVDEPAVRDVVLHSSGRRGHRVG